MKEINNTEVKYDDNKQLSGFLGNAECFDIFHC